MKHPSALFGNHFPPLWGPMAMAVLSLLIGLSLSHYVATLEQTSQRSALRTATMQFLSSLRARIEAEIYSSLYLSKSLTAYVAIHPDISQAEFTDLASEIIKGSNTGIHGIALARNNVISHIYPLAGNGPAIGLDYRKSAKRWPVVARAIKSRSTVVAGPVDLVQGGSGIIARTPIYLKPDRFGLNKQGKPIYWGLSSLVIDLPEFIRALRLSNLTNDYDYALRGRDGRGASSNIIFGDAALFEDDPVLLSVYLPNGSWQLAARPRAGWTTSTFTQPGFKVGVIASLVIAILIGLLLGTRQQARQLALVDYLTKLPNRRLLQDRMHQAAALADRHRTGFYLIFVDLNGFKQINDHYGHMLGDRVLCEVAERLLANVRLSDTVARIGGDEFVILVNDATGQPTIEMLLDKIHQALSPPLFPEGENILISASLGHAYYPKDSRNLDVLLSHADKKMYDDKQGRISQLLHLKQPN